ncbi:oxidoreductase [Phyllobacterium sp. 22229]|uniref:oxidoreductase n=1 Tax=Phyllobacterium sp. 22229 TaxID=3453895 RepID=UPI003F847563
MGTPPLTDELCREAVEALKAAGGIKAKAAGAMNVPISTFKFWIKVAARRGLMGFSPVLEGFELAKSTTVYGKDGAVVREFVQQRPERELSHFNLPQGHIIKGMSALVDANGHQVQAWYKTSLEAAQRDLAMRAVIDALKQEIAPVAPVKGPELCNSLLLNQFTITDVHMGALAWGEESGADYDLQIAEKLLIDWFSAAIAMAPNAHTAVLAQLGDLLHYDSLDSETPANRHVLDADSRFPKMVRAAIRVFRRIIAMLLTSHEHVHIIMADANHDPASETWLREFLCVLYEDEPRVTVDTSASTYYSYSHGETSLFFHHGHKRGVKNIDHVFAGQFRELYGSTKHSYAHVGHLHSDEDISTNLMKVERHETLAAKDAYAARGGWLSKRSAKVITYHKQWGEVGRITLSPEMVTT